MIQQMTFSRFETLNQQLIGFLPRIKDTGTLLKFARYLLEGELSILLQRGDGNEEKRILLGVDPSPDREWVEKNLKNLYSWYGKDSPGTEIHGYHKESQLVVGKRTFSDALVAFGGIIPRKKPPQHELVVFQAAHATQRYSSYHCWAGAALLRHYEQIEAINLLERLQSQRANEEYNRAEQLSGLISEEVLRNETWDQFTRRLKKSKNKKLEDFNFMSASAVIWTGYQVRVSGEPQRTSTQNDQKNSRSALTWFEEEIGKDAVKKVQFSLYYDTMKFLLEEKYLPKELADEIKKLDLLNADKRKATMVTLEHAWYLVKETNFPKNKNIDIAAKKNDLEALFSLTSTLLIEEFTRNGKVGSELNRDIMRLYLANLLLNAPRLRKRYVGLYKDDYAYLVPREVQRQFMVNLSRYMLGIIEILERGNGVDIEPRLVSRVEFLDSLLYLIDRYSHVELQVDERLNIREHLGRGFASEIEHHLGRSFYRDHLLHVIDVFLIGYMLLDTHFTWLNDTKQRFIDHIYRLVNPSSQPHTPEDLLREWAAAALLHDIGYQLNNKSGNPELYRSFFYLCGNIYPDWLNVDAESSTCKNQKNQEEFTDRLFSCLSEFSNSGEWLPKEKESFKLTDHGILSSLRLAQVLVHEEAQGKPVGTLTDSGLLKQYKHTLHAVAHHNLFNQKVSFTKHPLTCLLRICDELQEWGRRRVNIEQIVKHLYIKIEEMDTQDLPSTENLERMDTNLVIEKVQVEGVEKLKISLQPDEPGFFFRLVYRNPMEAHLDSTTTFLSKAYNLQHLDMNSETPNATVSMEFRIEMDFPCPAEYFGLTEVDIYGLYTERIRSLPLLLVSSDMFKAPAGMVQLKAGEKSPLMDRIGIILKGKADPKDRKIWLPCNPASFFDDFIEFKKKVLMNRTQEIR